MDSHSVQSDENVVFCRFVCYTLSSQSVAAALKAILDFKPDAVLFVSPDS